MKLGRKKQTTFVYNYQFWHVHRTTWTLSLRDFKTDYSLKRNFVSNVFINRVQILVQLKHTSIRIFWGIYQYIRSFWLTFQIIYYNNSSQCSIYHFTNLNTHLFSTQHCIIYNYIDIYFRVSLKQFRIMLIGYFKALYSYHTSTLFTNLMLNILLYI